MAKYQSAWKLYILLFWALSTRGNEIWWNKINLIHWLQSKHERELIIGSRRSHCGGWPHKTVPKVGTTLAPLALKSVMKVCMYLVAQSCPALCDLIYCSPPGSSVHGILQARVLEWAAIPFSRGSSQPRDWTQVSCIAGGFFTLWATREAHNYIFGGFSKLIVHQKYAFRKILYI